jgi:hypothetical protein
LLAQSNNARPKTQYGARRTIAFDNKSRRMIILASSAHKQAAIELFRVANGGEVEIFQVCPADPVEVFGCDAIDFVDPGNQSPPVSAE